MTIKRETEIAWWHKIGLIGRTRHYLNYKKHHFTPAEKPSQLTGREIEIIYDTKHKQP